MNFKEYKHFQSILDNPDLREVLGEEYIKELSDKIERFEKGLKDAKWMTSYMTQEELDEFAELLMK